MVNSPYQKYDDFWLQKSTDWQDVICLYVLHCYHTNHVLTIFLCKSAGLQKCDFSVIIKVFFVPNKDYDNVWTGQSPRICQPVCQRIVCFAAKKKQYDINCRKYYWYLY